MIFSLAVQRVIELAGLVVSLHFATLPSLCTLARARLVVALKVVVTRCEIVCLRLLHMRLGLRSVRSIRRSIKCDVPAKSFGRFQVFRLRRLTMGVSRKLVRLRRNLMRRFGHRRSKRRLMILGALGIRVCVGRSRARPFSLGGTVSLVRSFRRILCPARRVDILWHYGVRAFITLRRCVEVRATRVEMRLRRFRHRLHWITLYRGAL